MTSLVTPTRRAWLRASIATVAAGLPAWAGATASPWRCATGYRADSFHGRNLAQCLEEWSAASQQAPKVELHPNNSLVNLAAIAGHVKARQIEMGETIMSTLINDMPVAGADSVPFVVRSYADARRLWRWQRPLVEQAFASMGITVLYAVPWPPQGLYTMRPLGSLAELRGSRMRSYNRSTARIAELLGCTAVEVPMSEVGQALADGRIDCMITSAVTGVENQAWKHLRHYHEINAWFPKNIVIANAKALAELDASARRGLLGAASAAEARGWAASESVAAESVAELKRQGMKVEPLPTNAMGEMRRLGERCSVEWIREVGPEANQIFVPYYTQA
ncbi:TRAP transporter substrate-binding protein [Ideonella sp. DXS29W]|uniref:TRAP transporter substrate-binding protein n=1 Tax=Ideonella lacteola TaxID=2984193 RepID=A0ABU9BI36_9BURK